MIAPQIHRAPTHLLSQITNTYHQIQNNCSTNTQSTSSPPPLNDKYTPQIQDFYCIYTRSTYSPPLLAGRSSPQAYFSCPRSVKTDLKFLNKMDKVTFQTELAKKLTTLFSPAYFSISRSQGGGTMCPPPPLNILGLGGVRVPILFGNDLLWNNLRYSKGFIKIGCLEPSEIMFDFETFSWSESRLTQFVRVPPFVKFWYF